MVKHKKKIYPFYKRKDKIILVLLYLVLAVVTMLMYGNGANGGMLEYASKYRLSFFYSHLDVGLNVWSYFLLLIFVSNYYSIECLENKKNGFSNFEKTRVGFKKYFKNNCIHCFLSTFLVVFSMLILKLIIITILYGHIGFSDDSEILTILSSNSKLNLVLYVFCTSIGCGIFSLFLYSLQRFIKNVYVFRFSGVVLGIVLYIAPVMLSRLVTGANNGLIFDITSSCFCIGNLINPGSLSLTTQFVPSLVAFLLCSIFYLTISFILLKMLYSEEKRYD